MKIQELSEDYKKMFNSIIGSTIIDWKYVNEDAGTYQLHLSNGITLWFRIGVFRMIRYRVELPSGRIWEHLRSELLDQLLSSDIVKIFQPQQVKVTFEYIGC